MLHLIPHQIANETGDADLAVGSTATGPLRRRLVERDGYVFHQAEPAQEIIGFIITRCPCINQ
jgi:hypothetical protein